MLGAGTGATPSAENKPGVPGGEHVSLGAQNNQRGPACGVEPQHTARPLGPSAVFRTRRFAGTDAASPPPLGDLNKLGELVLGQRRGDEFEGAASAITSSIPEIRSGSTAAGGRNSCQTRLAVASDSFAKAA